MTRTCLATPEEPDDPNNDADKTWSSMDVESASDENLSDLAYRRGSCAHVTFIDMSVPLNIDVIPAMTFRPESGIAIRGTLSSPIKDDPFAEAIRKSLISSGAARKRGWHVRVPPQKLAGLAVLIAGRQRSAELEVEWRAHLSGKAGSGLPANRQVRAAAGFVHAALRYRLQDAADFAWRPVDTLLASRELSNLAVLVPVLAVAVVFLRHGGLYNLALNFQNVGAVWVAAYGLIRIGRWWREVKSPKRKPRRIRE